MEQQSAAPIPKAPLAVTPQIQPSFQVPAVGQLSAAMPAAAVYPAPIPLAYQHLHQPQLQQFWTSQMQEIEQVNDFKTHQLPLARIKKIMKADEDVRMISVEAPVVFAKACELFILELTLRSWMNAEENKRRTLQKNDIASAITRTDIFDFLVDIVPTDAMQSGGIYYMQQAPLTTRGLCQPTQGMIGSADAISGLSPTPMDAAMDMSQQKSGMPYMAHKQMQPVWQPPRVVDMPADDPPKASP